MAKAIPLIRSSLLSEFPALVRDLDGSLEEANSLMSRVSGRDRQRLEEDFGIRFNGLLTITNLPIKRFEHYLSRTGQLESYQQLLADNFNPETVPPLMCRHLLSVDWQGYVYDCDFNQMLGMPMAATGRKKLWEVDGSQLGGKPVAIAGHCFGCTAGAGSSCGGALT